MNKANEIIRVSIERPDLGYREVAKVVGESWYMTRKVRIAAGIRTDTTADYARIAAALKRWPDLGYRQIADRLSVSVATVYRVNRRYRIRLKRANSRKD